MNEEPPNDCSARNGIARGHTRATGSHVAPSRGLRLRRPASAALGLAATTLAFVLALAPSRVHAQAPSTEGADDATAHLTEAYRALAAGETDVARVEFHAALERGGDPQRIHMELGYLERRAGNVAAARSHFEAAAGGPDEEMAGSARAAAGTMPNYVWGDMYLEAFGWHRFVGVESTNLVPTLRMRALFRPFLSNDVDFNFYLYGQITRDVASRDRTASSIPLVFADNHALLGGGALLRLFERHLALFAQVGPAFNLLDDGRDRISLDARVGLMAYGESDQCRVPAYDGVRAPAAPCLEGYGEVTYVSRFHHDVIGTLRGRAGYGVLLTGPVLWQPLIEIRAVAARNLDYYNNFAEVGVGHRWRLLEPFGLDLITTLHGGAYYGVSNTDALPPSPFYLEARALLVSYVEIR